MNSTKLSAFCDKVLEIAWLLAVVITPLFFNVYSSRVFEPDKLTTLRTVAVIMAAVWLVKLIEERVAGRQEIGFTWRTPLVLPTLFTVIVYLLSTLLSVTTRVSMLGSYQRLQGTYTTLAYIVVFLVILQGLRTRAQLDRLITVIIVNSLPIALYGLIQRNRLDPLPWGGGVTQRVAANMGNAIFVAAYLIMIFPLVVGRIAESFHAILTEEESDWADIPRAAGYIFIAAVDLIAIWYAQSRGPLLGFIAASYFLFLLLAWSARNKLGAASILIIVTVTALVVGFLAVVNIPGGPLQSLQRAPWLGRLGEVFDFEHGTGRVRALIWEGMVDLVLPHEPIRYPDGHPDPINGLRPLVGYGPESIYVAYNRFYPPLLGHHESRTASPDRSHNETLDSLAITGLLGLVAYLGVFGSVFYYSFEWLGLVADRKDRTLLLGLVGGLSVASVAFFWWWQGLHFFGAALTLGAVAGMGIYVALKVFVSAVRVFRSSERVSESASQRVSESASQRILHPHHFLLISLFAAMIAHFVEINFGIAIASTRTTFWACAGVLVVVGLELVREGEPSPQPSPYKGEGAGHSPRPSPSQGEGGGRRRKRRKTASPPPGQTAPLGWLGPVLAVAVVGGFILGTLGFDFVTNAERLTQPMSIVWRALTVLPAQGSRTSYGALMIVVLAWLMSAVIFVSEMAKRGSESAFGAGRGGSESGRQGTFNGRKGDGPLATVVYLLVSLTLGFAFALVLAGRQAAMMQVQAQTVADVIAVADQVAGLLTHYYGFIFFALIAGGTALFLGMRRRPQQVMSPWGGLALVVLVVLAIAIAVVTNLRPIQADVVYKQADPYDRQAQWVVAIEHYNHAIDLAPEEDFYYLYLGRAYLEYATTLEDPAVREVVLQETEQTLTEARQINPLNTDHSANLARMYRRWADFASDDETRLTMLRRSSENYEIATSLSPHNAILWNEWAMLYYYGLGDVAGYERTIQRSLELDAEFEQTWLVCGDANRQQNNLEEAAHCYEEALKLNAGASQVWRALGDTYIAMQQWEQAIDALGQVVELEPDAGDIWNIYQVLARLHSQLGQNEQALAYATTALQLAPDDQQTALQDLVAQLQALETSPRLPDSDPQ